MRYPSPQFHLLIEGHGKGLVTFIITTEQWNETTQYSPKAQYACCDLLAYDLQIATCVLQNHSRTLHTCMCRIEYLFN